MFSHLTHIYRFLSGKEKKLFFVFLAFALSSGIALAANAFYGATERVAVSGGTYIEGIVGQPIYINPVISGTNDVDRDIVRLIFNNVAEVAEKIEPSKDGKTWTVRILEDVFWHDGKPLTSDDVIFTILAIQDPEARSPLANTLQDVSLERVSERELTLILPTAYAFFEDNLANIYIIPKHVFGAVPVANWRLSAYNLEPVGSGPYVMRSSLIERSGFISELRLERNKNYFAGQPLIENLALRFYKDEGELLNAFNTARIDGFLATDTRILPEVLRAHRIVSLPTSLYYAIFFNQSAQNALKDKNVRLALNYAIPRGELVADVLSANGVEIYSPLKRFLGDKAADSSIDKGVFSADAASDVLEQGGWKLNEEGIRERNGIVLEFKLAVPQYPLLIETADVVKSAWEKIGVRINIEVFSPQEINRELIRARNYEMILFGNSLWNADLFSFWHSSERFYPGLNLALYENSAADKLIESIRKNFDAEAQISDLASLDSLIVQSLPAAFLYSPNYLYVSIPNFGGLSEELLVTGSDRFNTVEKWYVRTARNIKNGND